MAEWKINLQQFIRAFEAQFEEIEEGSLKPETNFRELEEWSSMQALMIIVFLDTDYGISVSAEELRSALTVQDLYKLVMSKAS